MVDYELILSYLDETCTILASWLEKKLPKLSSKWWNDNVIEKLTITQKNYVISKGIKTLSTLDFFALFRVFEQNWYELCKVDKKIYKDKKYIKEMSSVQNRWIHKPVDGYDQDVIYNDLDTIQRFLSLMNEEHVLVKKIKEKKESVFSNITTKPNIHLDKSIISSNFNYEDINFKNNKILIRYLDKKIIYRAIIEYRVQDTFKNIKPGFKKQVQRKSGKVLSLS